MRVLLGNPYAQFFRRLEDAPLDAYEIRIRSDVKLDQRIYNSPSIDQVVTIWIEENNPNVAHERDIIVHAHSGHKHTVKHYYGCYDPLQYPLSFPQGDVGWHQNILKRNCAQANYHMTHSYGDSCVHDYESIKDIMNREQKNVDSGGNKKVSCHQYYCYKLQIRDDKSILLYFGWLLQQCVVDMYIKLKTTRLDYYWR